MSNFITDLKQKYLDILRPAQQTLGNIGQNFNKPITAKGIGNQTPINWGQVANNAVVKLGQSPVGKGIVNFQRGIETRTLPRVNLQQYTQNIQKPVPRTIAGFGAAVGENLVNLPQRLLEGGGRAGLILRDAQQGKQITPQRVIGAGASIAEPLFDIATLGGGTLFKQVGKNMAKQAIKQGLKQTGGQVIRQAAKTGALQGAGYGSVFGGLRGLSEGDEAELGNFLKGTAGGAALGGVFGAGTGAVGGLVGRIISFVKKDNPNMSNTEAIKKTKDYLRDRLGRFSGFNKTKDIISGGAKGNYVVKGNQPIKITKGGETVGWMDRIDKDLGVDKDWQPSAGLSIKLVKPTTPKGGAGLSDMEVKRVADNILKNNSGITRGDAEAMARDVIRNRPFNQSPLAPKGGVGVKNQLPVKPMLPQAKVAEIPVSGRLNQKTSPGKGISLPNIISQKERGFITTVKEAKTTKPDVAKQVQGYYSPTSNPELIAKANYTVNTSYDLAKQRVLKEPLTAETNAMGQEIMRQAQNAGKYDEAIQMAETLARKGTEAGQSVQAFSNWARLTPEGMLRYAQKEILTANEKMGILTKVFRNAFGRGEVKFTSEDAKVITNLMKKANGTTDEALRSNYIKQTFEYIGKKLPWGVSDLIDSYRYNNMLSNPLTQLRNAVNNLQQALVTRPATILAEGRPIEAIKYEIGTLKALPEAFTNFVKSFKGNVSFGKMDTEAISKLRPIKPNRIGFLNLPSKAMEASDQFFRTLIRGGEIARGTGAKEAEKLAEYSLFRSELNLQQQGFLLNKIDDVTKAVYQLRKVGLGWFIPFIRTPMNVAKQWIEYSPMGVATIPGAGNKRTQIAKTLLGTMATMIGANVALQDRTTWAPPTDPKAKELFYASGKKPYSIKIKDKWVPLQTFGVFAWALGIPAAVKFYNDDSRTALTDSQIEKLTKSMLSLGGFFSNQTFVSGLGSFVKIAEGDMDYTLSKNIAFTLGQLKPWEGLMRYVSTVIDPIYRKPSGFTQQLQADIPILTKGLPAYREPSGEPSTRNVSNYIAPYGVGQEKPEYNELYNMRNLQLQNNAVLNKQKKDLERQLNSTNPMQVQAAETGSLVEDFKQNPLAQQRMKLQEDLFKQKVQMTGQSGVINGNYWYQNENGNAVSIPLDRKLKKPTLTGNYEIDKIKLSQYSSSVTSKINDIIKLNELGQLTNEEMIKKVTELKNLQKQIKAVTATPKKGKKIKVKAIKLKLPKAKKIKVKAIKPKKVKVYKMKKVKKLSTKIKKIKLTQS